MRIIIFICLVGISCQHAIAQKVSVTANKKELIFSAIKGTQSKTDTVILSATKSVKIKDVVFNASAAPYFKLVSVKPTIVSPTKNESLAFLFSPPPNFTGIAEGSVLILGPNISIALHGLSTKGLEGENEAPLSMIVSTLGYSIDVGWKTLPNHTRPEIQGEELGVAQFTRAANGPVEIIPVARYSPDFPLNFGYSINSSNGPKQFQVGILAKADKFPEHQTLFPKVFRGSTSFDPGDQSFGFYATSPDHTLYSEDCWNILFHPAKAGHAIRSYPVKDKTGKRVENTYLICMEEAANGDYNDYVFLIKNIKPALTQQEFTPLMNGKNLEGWYTWLQNKGKNNDPESNFTVEEGGILHDTGKELGYIMTTQSFSNFHMKLEFKWGEKKWAPRDKAKRDSGICYNIPDQAGDFIWPQSIECQVQEGDVGDFWLLEYSTVQVDGKQNAPSNHTRIEKKKDAEKPSGEWNIVEVISFNGKCVHIVNGVVVNYGENASLVGGRILLQSEYAEIYYRNVMIRKL